VVNRGRIVYLTHVTDKEKLKVTCCWNFIEKLYDKA
jgi:hypothetical protein